MYSFGQSPCGEPKTENLKIGKLWRTTKNLQYHAKLFSI